MRIDIDDATIDEDGSLYLYNGEPVTGELSETHPNGTLVSLIPVRDGRVSGVERLWYPDGTPRLESTVFNGLAVGTEPGVAPQRAARRGTGVRRPRQPALPSAVGPGRQADPREAAACHHLIRGAAAPFRDPGDAHPQGP